MTDATLSATAAHAAATRALQSAAEKTGIGFDYLYRVAMRESAMNPAAKATTSSAAGLFQFIERTWLAAVKKYGPAHGLGGFAEAISADAKGRLFVADAARRQEILDLRFDPEKAAALAGELARENRASLERALGRAVDAAELYAAHFLGPAGAKKLLAADGAQNAAALLPAAAEANHHVFYDGARARTVAEVVGDFRKTIGVAKAAIADVGGRIEKSLAPLLRETASLRDLHLPRPEQARPAGASEGGVGLVRSSGVETAPPRYEIKRLSPLILAALQAFDPRARRARDGE